MSTNDDALAQIMAEIERHLARREDYCEACGSTYETDCAAAIWRVAQAATRGEAP